MRNATQRRARARARLRACTEFLTKKRRKCFCTSAAKNAPLREIRRAAFYVSASIPSLKPTSPPIHLDGFIPAHRNAPEFSQRGAQRRMTWRLNFPPRRARIYTHTSRRRGPGPLPAVLGTWPWNSLGDGGCWRDSRRKRLPERGSTSPRVFARATRDAPHVKRTRNHARAILRISECFNSRRIHERSNRRQVLRAIYRSERN